MPGLTLVVPAAGGAVDGAIGEGLGDSGAAWQPSSSRLDNSKRGNEPATRLGNMRASWIALCGRAMRRVARGSLGGCGE
jgi:hypothetical protein